MKKKTATKERKTPTAWSEKRKKERKKERKRGRERRNSTPCQFGSSWAGIRTAKESQKNRHFKESSLPKAAPQKNIAVSGINSGHCLPDKVSTRNTRRFSRIPAISWSILLLSYGHRSCPAYHRRNPVMSKNPDRWTGPIDVPSTIRCIHTVK